MRSYTRYDITISNHEFILKTLHDSTQHFLIEILT